MSDGSAFAPDASFAWLALCVATAYTAEATIGFGSIVIALTLGAWLYPIPQLLPLLVPLSVMLTTVIVSRNHRHVDRRLIFAGILPRMGVGLVLGFAIFTRVPTAWLTSALGLLVTAIALLELRRSFAGADRTPRPLGAVAFTGVTLGAGVMQGAAASGGPLLVYALGRLGLPKSRFRASLAVVWLILNSVLVTSYVATGRLDAHSFSFTLLLVPVVVASLALGNWLHHRLDEDVFRKVVLGLLTVAGLALAL